MKHWWGNVPYSAWQEIENTILDGKEPPDHKEVIKRHNAFIRKKLDEDPMWKIKNREKENILESYEPPEPTPEDLQDIAEESDSEFSPWLLSIIGFLALTLLAIVVILRKRKKG